MVFTDKTLTTLEFDKITEMLAEHAATEGAKGRCLSLMPTDDFDTVKLRQTRTDDAFSVLERACFGSGNAQRNAQNFLRL